MSGQVDDFFVVGGTIRPQSPAYINRPADDELFQRLLAGDFCYVLTARQMGKSSLMVRTARRLSERGVDCVLIDLTAIGRVNIDAWYLGLLSAIRSQLRLSINPTSWWVEHADMSAPQRWIKFLRDVLVEIKTPFVIFIDEIDTTLSLNFRDDFFAAIRGIYNNRSTEPAFQQLSFALFGVASPTDLIQDRARTPFNIGQRVELSELSLSDAAPLAKTLDIRHPSSGTSILERVFYWTNGHPYLTQKVCAYAVNKDINYWQNIHVDALVEHSLINERADDENLKFVQNRVRGISIPERRQLLRLYRRVRQGERIRDDDRSPIQNQLELTGLVTVVEGYLCVRNRIYQTVFDEWWIKANLPRDRQLFIAIGSLTFAIMLIIALGLKIWLAPTPTDSLAQGYIDNFEATLNQETADNHTTRLDTLSRLFELNDYRANQAALRLFYDKLHIEQQENLFIRSDTSDKRRMLAVVRNIIATLGVEQNGADQRLLGAMGTGLANISGSPSPAQNSTSEIIQLTSLLNMWREGRKALRQGNYDTAVTYYNAIQSELPNSLPAFLYDRAVANTRRHTPDYVAALRDLNAMLDIAATMPTPAPTTPTPAQEFTNLISTIPPTTNMVGMLTSTATILANATEGLTALKTNSTSTVIGNVGEQARLDLQDTNRFRDEQEIRQVIANLFETDIALMQAYRAAFGEKTYPRLETFFTPRIMITETPSPTQVATHTPTPTATPCPVSLCTPTSAPTRTPTSTPTRTPTPPRTPTRTPTPARISISTKTPLPSDTPIPLDKPELTDTPRLTNTPINLPNNILIAIADTYVRGGRYSNDNYGSEPTLVVKDGSDNFNRNTYIKFDLSNLSKKVTYVGLRVMVGKVTNGVPAPLFVFGMEDDSWDEMTMTWNNRPLVDSQQLLSQAQVSQTGIIEFDVTDYINAQITGDKIASIVLSDETTARRILELSSREGTTSPVLIVQ